MIANIIIIEDPRNVEKRDPGPDSGDKEQAQDSCCGHGEEKEQAHVKEHGPGLFPPFHGGREGGELNSE